MTTVPSLFDDEQPTEPNHPGGAPPLDWWVIATTKDEAYRRIIAAMCPSRVCQQCGEPSRRMTDRTYQSAFVPGPAYETPDTWKGDKSNPRERRPDGTFLPRDNYEDRAKTVGRGGVITRMGDGVNIETLGFSDCGHDDWRPGVWLDPFNPEAS